MMDNRCPICGRYSQEYQQQRSRTETDKYHGVKKFGLKQGAGFVAGQIADAIVPGLGTFASVVTKSLAGDYYDENHPKSKTHYYTYHYYQCNQCRQEWTRDSDGMQMIDDYYANQYKDDETPAQWCFMPLIMPYFILLCAIILNFIFAILGFFFGWLGFRSTFEWIPEVYFSASWWPTIKWLVGFASFSWIFYVIYVPFVFFIFVLPPLRHNRRVNAEVYAKKQALANRLGGQNGNGGNNTPTCSNKQIQKYDNGDRYEGKITNNQRNGKGTYFWKDGRKYVGGWQNNEQNGHGKYYNSNGQLLFEGNWSKGYPLNGTYYYSDGSYYEGDLNEDWERDGQGTYYWKDGSRHAGMWSHDKRCGYGEYYDDKGRLTQKGEWSNDEYIAKSKKR